MADEQTRSSITIIAVDPGKRTGVAVWRNETFSSFEFEVAEFFDFIHSFIHDVYETTEDPNDIHIVAESFIITMNTAKNTQSTWSLELIGVLKFLAHRYHLRGVTLQAPNIGKTFGTNGKLELLDWKKPNNVDGVMYAGHANDAARHLMTYAAQRGLIFTEAELISMADV